MLPAATVPAARGSAMPPDRAAGGGARVPRRERRKGPVRDAAAGLAEVMAMPAIWRDADGGLLELPGPGSGIVACGALPGAAAPAPAWTAGDLEAAGVAASPGPVREGTGLGLASAVITPALLDQVLAPVPARRARKITPRLAVQVDLARALGPAPAPAALRALAQRPRETDPGYDLPAASSLSDAGSFLLVRPFPRLLAGLCGEVRAAIRLRPLQVPGGPWAGGRWHGLRVVAKDGTARQVADPKGSDRKGAGGTSRNAAHFGRPPGTGADAAPQIRMVEVTDVWCRGCAAWAAGPYHVGETTLAAHLEPAYGPGDLDIADRGFPSREAVAAKITAGKHFAWRVSSAWNLRRCGRPLPDGTWKTKITWQGRTFKVRVVEYHMDQVFDLPADHPLLAAAPPGPSVRVLDDGGDAGQDGMCRGPAGTVRVEVSETVTIITSLMDTIACPARDIAELYGLRWAVELVYLEEKQTLSGGQPVTAATPAGAYRMAAATVAAHQALRLLGAAAATAIGAEPARISVTALRDTVTGEHPRRPGRRHHRPDRRHQHHRPGHRPPPAAVRHRLAARPALPPVHHQEGQDPQKQARRARRGAAAPAAPAAAGHGATRAAERAASRLTVNPPTRPGTAAPGCRHARTRASRQDTADHPRLAVP